MSKYNDLDMTEHLFREVRRKGKTINVIHSNMKTEVYMLSINSTIT